jgi:predicted nucleic acid-binding protein
MILADTSILIELARKPTLPVARVVLSGRPVVCGITIAELYAGVHTEVQRARLEGSLGLFGQIDMEDVVWPLTGRISGAMARRRWTRDQHFAWVQAAFPELVLFDEAAA